ncbi:tetratricopeptide repeat protein [Nonomuraea sp. NPDC050783]|uniref:tetratricopeptide repeat protein n=1 Tax=Nonomuraea sp. NPDC050783 TaxID=3154634 RepID=UPI0034652069
MASEQLDAAMNCWKAGELDQAATLFRQIAATGDPEASHLLAGLLQEQGDLDGAEAAHRAVILSGDPVFGQRSAMAMGMMLIAAKEWPAAHRVLTIASDGADFEVAALADTALVLVCTQLGDAPGAERALERARRCDSAAVAELAARLELPDFDQDPASARARYAAAEDEDDLRALLTCGDPEVVALAAFRLHRLHTEAGDHAAARAVCEHAIAVGHPDHLATAHHLLGAALASLGEYAEAAAAYRIAAEDPRPDVRLPSLIELATVTAQLGGQDETEAVLRRVVASGHPEYAVRAQACLARTRAEAGDTAGALAAARAVLEAGENEWAAFCVTLLGTLLDRGPGAYAEVMELARLAAGHPDPDAAFKARLLLDRDDRRRPLADPVAERAAQDVDAALGLLRGGDLAGARRLLRRAADSGAGPQAVRAMVALAELELGEGDREQADELLAYVAEGDDLGQGLTACLLLHLLRGCAGREPHPVLRAVAEHRRLGREEGPARHRAVAGHPDPAVAALGSAVLAQVLAASGFPPAETSRLLERAAGAGEPLALSYAAALARELLPEREQAVALLRRARDEGHPVLAPWVGYRLGTLVEESDPGEARAAYAMALDSPHRGLRAEAAGSLGALYERQGDLVAAARLHELRLAREDGEEAARAAWLLGLTRMRLDDPDGARAAFGRATGEPAALGRFARTLLDGDLAGAATALAEVPGDGNALLAGLLALESAHCRWRRGDLGAAEDVLSLAAGSGHPAFRQEAWRHLGTLREETGDLEGALAAWEQAAKDTNGTETAPTRNRPGTAPVGDGAEAVLALDGLARVLLRLGRAGEAADACRRALALDGDPRPGTTALLAEALVEAGDPDAARKLLEEAPSAELRLRLATALRDHGDPHAALATLTALAGSKESAHPHHPSENPEPGEAPRRRRRPDGTGSREARLLGELLAETGDMAGAEAAFERAVAADPATAARTLLTAARLAARAGHAEYARTAWERAATQDDDPWAAAVARTQLGTATAEDQTRATPEKRGRVPAADGGRLTALVEVTGSATAAELVLALDGGDVPAARRLLAALTGGDRRDGLLRTLDAAGRAPDGTAARRLYRLVVEMGDPETAARASLAMGASWAQDGHPGRAELCLLPATGHPATAPDAWRHLAVVRRRRGDLDGSVEALRAGMPRTAAMLAGTLEERGDAPGARRVLADGAAAGDLECLRLLVDHLIGERDHEAAAEAADHAVATGDPETVATGYRGWGDACRDTGDLRGAALMYRRGIDGGFAPLVPGLRARLAEVLRELGDRAGAYEQARAAAAAGQPEAAAVAHLLIGRWRRDEGDVLAAAEAFGAALADGLGDTPVGGLMSGLRGGLTGGLTGGGAGSAAPVAEALEGLGALARQEFERGAHDATARVLDLMGEAGAALARELGEECADPAAVRAYFARSGQGPFAELMAADRLAALGERAEARAILDRLGAHDDPEVRSAATARLLDLLDGDRDGEGGAEAGTGTPAMGVPGRSRDGRAERDGRDDRDTRGARRRRGGQGGMGGERAESLRMLREVAADGTPLALFTLAQTLAGAGLLEEGRAAYLRVVEAGDPDLAARAMVALGRTYHDEDAELAREWYLRATRATAEATAARGAGSAAWTADGHTAALAAMHLGALAKRERDFPEALTWYQRVIDAGDAESGTAAAHLGELCYWLGDRDGALRFYELTLGLTEQPDLVAEAACRLGEIRYERGEVAAARRLLRAAADSGDPSFAPRAGSLLARLG